MYLQVNYENDMKPLDASSSQPLDDLNKSTQNLSLEDKAAFQEWGCVLAWLVTVQRPKREINYAIASMEQQQLPRELVSIILIEWAVVLARSTRVGPTAIIDPLTWLACLKSEGRHRVYDSKRDHKKKIRGKFYDLLA
ncbi:hypothetical protein L195_g043296 [Trifolium pratense]|uniref:Uncharacterized protein n=1 Tax=Trifolium pratense TaxID=57577 RepID=A0A2K3M8U8_TRIPR|nr:hypothetical protein L195_g043296 [Trifolium pratense]